MAPAKPILIYSPADCADCRRVKQFLAQHGIDYRWIDIEHDAKAARVALKLSRGSKSVPVVQLPSGDVLIEPTNAELAQRLGLANSQGSVMREVIIIGSGPAGLTAAIYAARAQLKPLVIEGGGSFPAGNLPGGQLMLTTEIENYPGFVEGIMGPDLMKNFRDQAARFGAEYLTEEVTKVDLSGRPFKVWVGKTLHEAKSVIVATGARSIMLGLDAETRLISRGVSTCATCDGFFFTGQNIVVVGGGDSAMEEALFLTKFADTVTIIHRRDQFRASKIMQERVLSHPKIKVIWDTEVVDLIGQDKLSGLKIKHKLTDKTSNLDVTGLFIAIGHSPNTSLFRDQLDMDNVGYLKAKGVHTNIPGVFAAGDAADHVYRQAITAAGTGAAAAIEAERFLEAQ